MNSVVVAKDYADYRKTMNVLIREQGNIRYEDNIGYCRVITEEDGSVILQPFEVYIEGIQRYPLNR